MPFLHHIPSSSAHGNDWFRSALLWSSMGSLTKRERTLTAGLSGDHPVVRVHFPSVFWRGVHCQSAFRSRVASIFEKCNFT